MLLETIFINHESSKIIIRLPILTATVIYIGLFIISLKKVEKTLNPKYLMNRNITEQLRGFAILLVVVGHIAIHIMENSSVLRFPAFGDFGVSIFLILSGFGLSMSYNDKKLTYRKFFKDRIRNVMIPYWLSTIILVGIDFYLLNRKYSFGDIFSTLMGINITITNRHIDYVRWYITAIIIWYVIFALSWQIKSIKGRIASIYVFALILFVINYYVFSFGYAFFSFPFGVVIGIYNREIKRFCNNFNKYYTKYNIIYFFIFIIIYNVYIFNFMDQYLPTIINSLIREIIWIISAAAIFLSFEFVAKKKSSFLCYIGKISYSIFLIHGALMIKYDFILFRAPIFITFWFYFIILVLLSYYFQKMYNSVQNAF